MKSLLYILILFPLFILQANANSCLEQSECRSGEKCYAFQCVAAESKCLSEFQCLIDSSKQQVRIKMIK